MGADTGIEWTDATWNPIVGCSIVSPGCTNCYAMSMAARIDKMTLSSHYEGLTEKVKGKHVWTGKVAEANPHIFGAPLRWRKPKRIFVNSMGDLFHEAIPDEWIDRVFAIMALTPRHSFQVLTKRAERMHRYVAGRHSRNEVELAAEAIRPSKGFAVSPKWCFAWPLPNVWLGVSAERQKEADERLPYLVNTPAAVRFVSYEPALGPLLLQHNDLRNGVVRNWLGKGGVNWVICGGESGRDARPMHPQWARDLRDQCRTAGVPFFFKQWGEFVAGPIIAAQDFDGGFFVDTDRHGRNAITRAIRLDEFYGAVNVGKKRAGRLLDGGEHNGMPA